MKKNLLITAVAFTMLTMATRGFASDGCPFAIKVIVTQPTCNGSCNGSIISTPDDPSATYFYLWSNGSTSSAIHNLCEDEYTVTMTDINGCSLSQTFTIEDPDPLVATCTVLAEETVYGAADGAIEAGATGGTLPYTFEWQTNPVVYGPQLTGLVCGDYYVIVYDANDCVASSDCHLICHKKDKCGPGRTQTQGGWGQCQQNGNNPGTYLAANFAAAFPNGLTIGCTKTLKLTSSQAVCDFLPSGSSPKVLNGNKVNPGGSYSNVFAGQLVTATINVGFDLYDDGFGVSDVNLGDMIFNTGTFAGWTINEIIAEANRKIGGCASSYSASALSDALDKFNNNYDNGNSDDGYLDCPETSGKVTSDDANFNMTVSPNPISDRALLTLSIVKNDVVEAELFTVAGQKAGVLFNGSVLAGDKLNIEFNVAQLEAGIYFIQVRTSESIQTQKIVITK